MTTDAAVPHTIVLVHGLWVTPRSWEHWIERYQDRGFRVLAPAYPGFEVEVEALREDPTPIEDASLSAVVGTSKRSSASSTRRPSSWVTRPVAPSPRS